MKKTTALFTSLALLGCLSGASLAVQAKDPTSNTEAKGGSLHPAELKVGEKAPEQSDRASEAIDWKAKGLPEPEKESQWVKIDNNYVRVQITNGRVMEIVPIKH